MYYDSHLKMKQYNDMNNKNERFNYLIGHITNLYTIKENNITDLNDLMAGRCNSW